MAGSVLMIGLAAGLICGPAVARATPLENTHPGGLNEGSPVDPHPASIVRNPAVMGILPGTHLFLDGTVRLELGRIRRLPIQSTTGNPGPGADLSFPREVYSHWTPDLYFGFTSDLGGLFSKRVTLGVALYTPYAEMQRYADPGQSDTAMGTAPSRYHRIAVDWFHLTLNVSAAIRLVDWLYIGLGFSYVRTMMRMAFGRDCAIRSCRLGAFVPPHENPLWFERVEVDLTDHSGSFNAGVLVRLPRRVDLGLAYRSKVVSLPVDTYDLRAHGKATVRRFDASTGQWEDPIRGRARAIYELPDALTLGVKWRLGRWDFTGSFEWERWSVHNRLKFTLTGNEFRAAEMSNWDINFVHYRGFQDVFRVALMAGYRFSKKLRLMGGGLFESSAVPRQWLSADAIDSHKGELIVSLVWRPHRSVGLHVGYSVTLAPDVDVSSSGFDPGYVVRCVEDQVDILWSENCQRTSEGKGLPTAAGRYWQMVHRLGIGVSYDYW